jgi:hypothetical protein
MADQTFAQDCTRQPRDLRLLAALAGLGLVGVAALLMAPLEQALPAGVKVPRAAMLVQPAILILFCAWLGWFTSPRTGLKAPVVAAALDGGNWRWPFAQALRPASLVAVLTAAVLFVYSLATASAFSGVATPSIPLVSKLAYGGISEEIMLRWGMLGGLMALALRLGLREPAAFWWANGLAALLFGFAHFGVVFALLASPPFWLLVAVLLANAIPALGFGILLRQRGLESAMLAHGGAHALFTGTMALAGMA